MYDHAFLNELDLDRLETVLEAPTGERGEGKTMGFVAKMVGEAHCGEGFRYMYIGENQSFCRDVLRSVVRILREQDVCVVPYVDRNYFIVEDDHVDRRFEFVSVRAMTYHHFQGPYLDALWVDLTTHTLYDPRHRELIARAHAQIRMEHR